MGEDLSPNQQKLNEMLNKWIKNKTIPQEFSYTIENEVGKIISSLIQFPPGYFEEDFMVLVEKGYFINIQNNEKCTYVSTHKE